MRKRAAPASRRQPTPKGGESAGEAAGATFTLSARARGFVYAGRGIRYFIATQHNAWIHLAVTAAVIAAGVHFGLDRADWCWLIVAIGLVLSAEAMNTALEALADAVSPEFHEGIGRAKDVAAGAVLILAVTAAIIGLMVFGPHLLSPRL